MPFERLRCTGWCATSSARRCRSRKGNGVDPLAWIDKYGADAVRFTLARGANPGSRPGHRRGMGGRFGQILHQAVQRHQVARMLNGASTAGRPLPRADLTPADRWVLDRLDQVISETTALLGDFQFGKAAEGLYHFAWDEFCDWYLELAKVQINGRRPRRPPSRPAAAWARCSIGCSGCCTRSMPVRDRTLCGPISPAAKRWSSPPWPQRLRPASPIRPRPPGWPTSDKLVTAIRRFRADQGLPPSRPVPAAVRRRDGCADGHGGRTDQAHRRRRRVSGHRDYRGAAVRRNGLGGDRHVDHVWTPEPKWPG